MMKELGWRWNGSDYNPPGLLYESLFEVAWQALNQVGSGEGLQLGMISVLHTGGQNLSLHPHLHCIVPGGGVDAQDRWHKKMRQTKFLFPLEALSKVFRSKYVQCLWVDGVANQRLFDRLSNKDWVVYAKHPFGGPSQVIEYLGHCTHKVAISNPRIKAVTSHHVSFSYKDL